jgi:hypothetical protein
VGGRSGGGPDFALLLGWRCIVTVGSSAYGLLDISPR